MAIKYVSEHHSSDDPGGLVKTVLDMGSEFPGPAEDIVMTWLLRLDDDRDPAEVAARLLADYGYAETPLPEGACGRVIELLRETADNKAGDRKARPLRRGGRRGRG